MANEVRKKIRGPITVQASSTLSSVPSFSAGTETPIDNTYDGGTENGLGADIARMSVAVSGTAPAGDAVAEIWTAQYDDDNSRYEEYEYALSVAIPSGTTGKTLSAGWIELGSTLTKAKIYGTGYVFTAELIATPVLPEIQ